MVSSGPADRPARHGYWFPLLLFGGLAALSLPLSVLASPRPATGVAILTREIYPTVTQAMYFGGGFASAPFPFPLGWYWVGVLLSGLLLTAAWYRWRDRRTGRSTALRGYLVTGLVLAIGAGLAILAWAGRSRVLGALTAVYLAAVCLAGWLGLQQASVTPALPYGDPGVLLHGDPGGLLPAAVLLLSGLAMLLAAGLRELRR